MVSYVCVRGHFSAVYMSMCESISVVHVKGFASFYASFSVVYVSVSSFGCLCECFSCVSKGFSLGLVGWFYLCMRMVILNNVPYGPISTAAK